MEWESFPTREGRRCLAVEAPWGEVEADYRDLVASYASEVQLPGFRPGRVPRPIVEQRFREAIFKDLGARVAERLGREAVREAGIEVLGPLQVSDVECEKGAPFRATIRYSHVPEFELPELTGLVDPDDPVDPRDQVSARLLERVAFEVPGSAIRQELDLDGLADSPTNGQAWREASDRIRLLLILKRIARAEGIEVGEEDVERRIDEKAAEFGKAPERLREELGSGPGRGRLRDLLLAEAVMDRLVERGSSRT